MRSRFGTGAMLVSLVLLCVLVVETLQLWTRDAFMEKGKSQFGDNIQYVSDYYDPPALTFDFSPSGAKTIAIIAVLAGVLATFLLVGKWRVLGLGLTWLFVAGLTLDGHFTEPVGSAWPFLFGGSIAAMLWQPIMSTLGARHGFYRKTPAPADAASLEHTRERELDLS